MLKKLFRFVFISGIALTILGTLATFGFYYSVKSGVFGKLPSDHELKDIRNFQASDIYSSDKVLLGRYFFENRTHVDLENISPFIIDALIATEDSRFYEHKGIDQRSLMRVLFKSIILNQKNAGGGSTISQQLIKNLFGRENHGFLSMPVAKIKEGILANKLNQLYTKEEILELYLNTVSFGEDTYGIGTACERFFSSSSKDIKIEEAAVLIGMLKAPTTYNPRLNPEKSLQRRNTVLTLLAQKEKINEEEKDKLIAKPIVLKYKREDLNDGKASYYRKFIQPELEEILKKTKKENGESYGLYKDGLKIYTTIDSRIQASAERDVFKHTKNLSLKLRKEWISKLKSNSKDLLTQEIHKTANYQNWKKEGKSDQEILELMNVKKAMTIFTFQGEKDTSMTSIDSLIHYSCMMQSTYLAMNPSTGELLAYVGGVNFKYFPYDRVHAHRQVGSVFKPILYSNALNQGTEICDEFKNQQIKYTQYEDWTPQNSDGAYGGKCSVAGALTNSVNTVSVQLLMKYGINQTLDYCKMLGIEDSLPAVPSLALGVASIPLFKMIEVYSTFANGGMKQDMYSIERIEDISGKIIYEHEKTLPSKLLEKEVTDDLALMLQSVVDNGTAQRLRTVYHFKDILAGKTGTTQDQTDGWFIGYNPTFLAGVWTGSDISAIHFSSIVDGQGANMALPIWAEVYKDIQSNLSRRKKYCSSFDIEKTIDCDLFTQESDGIIHQLFKKKGAKINSSDGLEKQERKGIFGRKK